jgi:hypothetical protein
MKLCWAEADGPIGWRPKYLLKPPCLRAPKLAWWDGDCRGTLPNSHRHLLAAGSAETSSDVTTCPFLGSLILQDDQAHEALVAFNFGATPSLPSPKVATR